MVWKEPKERKDVESLKNVGDWAYVHNVTSLSCSYAFGKEGKLLECGLGYKKPSESQYGTRTKIVEDVKLFRANPASLVRGYVYPSLASDAIYVASDAIYNTSLEFTPPLTCKIELNDKKKKMIKCE